MQFYISAVACYNFELTISLFTATVIIASWYFHTISSRTARVCGKRAFHRSAMYMRSSETVRGVQTRRRATIARARACDCISSTARRTHDNELNYVSLYRVTMRSQNYASTTGTSSLRHVTAVMRQPWFQQGRKGKRVPNKTWSEINADKQTKISTN